MQRFNDILFWHENILKMDHLKQVYLTKPTDDARKTSAIRGQDQDQDSLLVNAETTITHQDLWLGNESLALTREVNLATQSSASSADEIRESGRAFQSLIVWGKKLPL